jgi:hypothetical protein
MADRPTRDEIVKVLRDLGNLPAGKSYWGPGDGPDNDGMWCIDWVGWPISDYLLAAADEIEKAKDG